MEIVFPTKQFQSFSIKTIMKTWNNLFHYQDIYDHS